MNTAQITGPQTSTSPTNLTRELEILYGYQKHLIFQLENPKESMKHISLAHQILKTIVAHNAVNESQEVVDITPQNTKALEDTQKVIEEQLNGDRTTVRRIKEHANTLETIRSILIRMRVPPVV